MKTPYAKYFAGLLLFGSNGIVASYIALGSSEIVLLRTLVGCLFMICLFLLSRERAVFLHFKRETLYLLLSGAAMGAGWLFLFEAYQQIGVSLSSLLYYCGPVIVMALSPLLFREKLTPAKCAGFAAVLLGVFLINGQSIQSGSNGWGVFCGAMSAVMYAVLVISSKKAENIKGLEKTTIQLIASLLVAAVFVLFKQGFAMDISASDWGPILFLGAVNTGVGCWLYFTSIVGLPVQTVAICGYLEPLSAVIFSVLILGETLSLPQTFGAALIVGGAIAGELLGSGKLGRRKRSAYS